MGGGWGRGFFSDSSSALGFILLFVLGYGRVISPPAGGAGGNELSGRTDPSALARGARTDGREWGAGAGEAHLNNDGSVIPFCSSPNIKSHIKFLA